MRGFLSDLRPEGRLENVLVDKLALLSWRYRRLIIAEAAEIEKGTAFLEADQKERQDNEAAETFPRVLDDESETVGLILAKENPQILEKCLWLLSDLKHEIEREGFDYEGDNAILTKLYGSGEGRGVNLVDSYRVWYNTAKCDDEERKQKGYASVEQCRKNFLEELNGVIRFLEEYGKARKSLEYHRINLESLRQNVPDSPRLDQLLRYETTLERSFDRTLTQLERLQRIRLGQPVPPPIKLDVSRDPGLPMQSDAIPLQAVRNPTRRKGPNRLRGTSSRTRSAAPSG